MRLLATLLLCLAPLRAAAEALTVFAAASLGTALDEVAALHPGEVRLSYAGSSALARQIAAGAPADVFVSASAEWMDDLAAKGLLQAGTRRDILGNTLVLIATAPAEPVPLDPGALEARIGTGRFAIALTNAVPAGIYGKAALESLGLWAAVEGRTAEADNVRAALALVALGAAPLGLVYATDAAAEPRVNVVAHIPEASHPPIRYPAAAIAGSGPEALAFLDLLESPEARAIFAHHGFVTPERP